MPDVPGHIKDAQDLFEDGDPLEGSGGTEIQSETITFENGGIAQLVRSGAFGEWSVRFYEPPEGETGPVTALKPVELPGGWTLIPLTGGAQPKLLPPQVDQTAQFIEIPEDPTQVLAVSATGAITVIQRSQTPIAAIEVGSQLQSDGTRRIFFADNTFRDVAPVASFQLGQIEERGDFQFVETSPGNFQRLPEAQIPQEPGSVVTIEGRQFIRQPDGSIQPLAAERIPSLDERISQALGEGNVDLALAFADFRDRPTSMEAFQAAMDFATSPGDVAAISAIARGHRLVSPPPAGEVQRIAAPPQFLEDAFARLQRSISGGSATPNDFMSIITQAATSEDEQRQRAEQAEAERIKTAEELDKAEDARIQGETDAIHEKRLADIKKETEDQAAAQAIADADTAIAATQATAAATAKKIVDEEALGLISPRRTELTAEEAAGLTQTDPGLLSTPVSQEDFATLGFSDFELSNIESLNQPETVSLDALDPSKFRFAGEDDFFAHGGTIDDGTAIVGEEGPELLIAPIGSKVIPLDGDETELAKLKRMMGIKGLEHGGTVESLLPIGVRQALRGAIIEPTRRRLSTAAGIPVLSAQAQQNLLPEELDVLDRLRAEAGIPLGAFQQEQASALPGAVRTRPSRFAARIAR